MMGRYDAHKNPFQYRMNTWGQRRITENREQEAKAIPCHVQKVEKDFIHVAFDTKNGIQTPPVMKMSQNFSRFGREPTQVGDRGMASPGDYYLGGNTAFAGGGTNMYPRGNLSTLAFQPLANLKAPKRDYDQHHETGGPHGWKVRTMEKQQEGGWGQGGESGTIGGDGGSNGGTGFSATNNQLARHRLQVMARTNYIQPIRASARSTGSSGSGGAGNGQSSQQQQDAQKQEKSKTELSFDKEGKVLLKSVDDDHYFYIDQQNQNAELQTQKKIMHQVKDEKWSVRVDKDHVHIRFEDNRIWVDKKGCWSSKPIAVRQDPYDD